MLPPEAARFEIRAGAPVLALDVDAPAALDDDKWGVMNRLTMVVVDGPGDAGFLLPRMTPAGDAAPDGWDEAVDQAGGVRVHFGGGSVFARSIG